MTDHIVFDTPGDFRALTACEEFANSCGFSVGRWERGAPAGVMFGDFRIAKWKNMSAAERRDLHATITGDGRDGPITLNIHTPCPPDAAERLRAANRARPVDG